MNYLEELHRAMTEVEAEIRGNPAAYGAPTPSDGPPSRSPPNVGSPTLPPSVGQPTRPPPVVHISCHCKAGKHRSVGLGELFAALLRELRWSVNLCHVSLENHGTGHRRCGSCTSGVVRQNRELIIDRWEQICQREL